MDNKFNNEIIAGQYDEYYLTETGQKTDEIEKQLIWELLKEVPKTTMLELGCGTGHWTKFFLDNGFQPVATDISDAMLKQLEKKGLPVKIIKADVSLLPFENESFDVVVSITMLEFVKDQEKAIKEMHRVLKPNGHLILGCLNALSELGKNKHNNEVFKNAGFFSIPELEKALTIFGQIMVKTGVHLSPTFEIMDGTAEKSHFEPAFVAIHAIKKQNNEYLS